MSLLSRFSLLRVRRLVALLPTLSRLAWLLARDERVPKRHRSVLLAGAAYAVAPVDLALDFIPVIGRLDDVLVLVASVGWVLRFAPPEAVDEHLAELGLTREELAQKVSDALPPPFDHLVRNYDTVFPEIESAARSVAGQGARVGRAVGRAAIDGGSRAARGARRARRSDETLEGTARTLPTHEPSAPTGL